MFSRSAEAADYFTEYDVKELDGWLAELGKDNPVPAHVEVADAQEDHAVAEAPRGNGRHRRRKPRMHFMRN